MVLSTVVWYTSISLIKPMFMVLLSVSGSFYCSFKYPVYNWVSFAYDIFLNCMFLFDSFTELILYIILKWKCCILRCCSFKGMFFKMICSSLKEQVKRWSFDTVLNEVLSYLCLYKECTSFHTSNRSQQCWKIRNMSTNVHSQVNEIVIDSMYVKIEYDLNNVV